MFSDGTAGGSNITSNIHLGSRAPSVPFLDLGRIHAPLAGGFQNDFGEIVARGSFVNGPEIEAFEESFAAYCGTTTCVALSSGLDALRLGLIAAGISANAEVLVPANTFAATIEGVIQSGARSVLVDVREIDANLDVAAAEAAVTSATEAVIPVHLYGQLVEPEPLLAFAMRNGLFVLEDACQAHGAERSSRRAGALGDAAAFSFYPGKNLGAFGDAGALVCSDPVTARRVRALREHGQTSKYHHEYVGYTARMDTLQAAVLLRKLPYLDLWNDERRRTAQRYVALLDGVGDLVLPRVEDEGNRPAWHLFVVRTSDPDALARHLAARGVGVGRHYPEPIHLLPAYRDLGYERGAFPVAERLCATSLSLPIFPFMTDSEVECVVDAVLDYFRG